MQEESVLLEKIPQGIPKFLNQNAMIIQSNRLVESGQSLTSVEARIVFALVSTLHPMTESRFELSRVPLRGLSEICDLDRYMGPKQIADACIGIMKKPVVFREKNNKGKDIMYVRSWFMRLNISKSDNYLEFQFHPDLVDDLLSFHASLIGYTSVGVSTVSVLRDVTAMRLFQIMVKNARFGHCVYSVNDLVFILQLQNKYFDKRVNLINTAKLLKNVIDPAIAKINELTYLNVCYMTEKEGRHIDRVVFDISIKEGATTKDYAKALAESIA